VFKKLFFILVSSFLILAFIDSPVLAQIDPSQVAEEQAPAAGSDSKTNSSDIVTNPDYVPPQSGQLPFSGQNQNYSVVFRGNGEAIVTLRVALTNTNEDNSPLSKVSLRIPKVQPTDISTYQIIVQPPCVRYSSTQVTTPGVYKPPNCIQYDEPDYYNYYSGGKYQKAQFDYSGDTLDIKLPSPIAAQKSGSFFVYFRAFGYAKKNLFGAYKFEFESLKVNQPINRLTVGISTDADQVLKNATGQVQYRFSDVSSAALKAAPSAEMGAVANPTIDSFVSQIGRGNIVKTASNLAALESYKVSGMYASSSVKLYGGELATAMVVVIFLIILAAFLVRKVMKRVVRAKVGTQESSLNSSDTDVMKNFLICLGASFISALLSAGYTVVVFIVGNSLDRLVGYPYVAVIVILLVVISFAMYLLFILTPAVYIGFKKGVGWGIGTFVMTTLWLVLFGATAVFILFSFRSSPVYPLPMMGATDAPGI
jgi:hypothetical protein